MKQMIANLVCGAALCAIALPVTGFGAEKGSRTVKSPAINERQHNQQVRIHQGVRSGELTPGEKARLEREEARIRLTERLAKSDGKLTAAERERLEKELNKVSHNIYEQKHDEQTRKE